MPLRTVLFPRHRDAGARFVEFGGWEMPLLYTGILEEHRAVRESAGLFDVSHMGKIFIEGPEALAFLGRLSSNDVPSDPGRARYTHLLRPDGTILDDVIVTCLSPSRFFLVCNAGPRASVLAWLGSFAGTGVSIRDSTTDIVCLAVQGPRAVSVVRRFTSTDIARIPRFRGALVDSLARPEHPVAEGGPQEIEGWGTAAREQTRLRSPEAAASDGIPRFLVTRTGYTGEPGFELFPRAPDGLRVWDALLAGGVDLGLTRIGLGARDTLRLEKGFLLSGQDFDGRQTPLDVGCDWVVRWGHAFVGRDALEVQRAAGSHRGFVGLRMEDRGIPRPGSAVHAGATHAGVVTSGTMSPSLRIGIALASLDAAHARIGERLDVDLRGVRHPARVVELPFL